MLSNKSKYYKSGYFKRYTRSIVEKHIKAINKKSVNFFSLPSDALVLEKRLINNNKNIKLYGVERDYNVFKSATSKMIRNNIAFKEFSNCDVIDYFNNNTTKFDAIWLDTCTPLNEKLLNTLINLVKTDNKLKYLAVTVIRAREVNNQKDNIKKRFYKALSYMNIFKYSYSQLFGDNTKESFELRDKLRIYGVSRLLNLNASLRNKSCIPIKVIKYQTSVPMMFILFKVANKKQKLILESIDIKQVA